MTFGLVDIGAIMPEIVLAVYACAVLMLDPFLPRERHAVLTYFSLVGLGLAFYGTARLMWIDVTVMGGMFVLDPYSNFFKILLYLAATLTILVSTGYLKRERIDLSEYYAFLLLATTGMMIMVSAADLIMIFLGVELTAVSFYILAGFKRFEKRSIEAAAKYFILGSFSSAILLFGISLVYGLAGSTNLAVVAQRIGSGELGAGWTTAMVFLAVGFGFKVAVVPFHMWTPDVYQGAPTPVTAYLAVGSKAAAFAVFLRVFLSALGPARGQWVVLLVVLALATMLVGNVVALVQTNLKRMLAYSSIAHAGYVLIGVVVGSPQGTFGLMLYLLIYSFMTVGAFGMLTLLRKGGLEGDEIDDLTGLSQRNPLGAFAMLVFMFALAGIPPTAGFIAKFYILMAAVEGGMAWLAVVAVLFAAVSAYFYIRVVMVMYMRDPEPEARPPVMVSAPAATVALTVALVAVILLGIFPEPVLNYTRNAVLQLK